MLLNYAVRKINRFINGLKVLLRQTIKQQLGFRKKEERNNVEKETYSINNVTTDSQGIKIAINGNSFSASSKLVRAIGYIRNYTRPWEDHKEKGLQNQ